MPRIRATPREMGTHDDAAPFVVAAYLRVSTDEQAKSGLGLADQRRRIAGMAAAKGWPEPLIYSDEGLSGARETAKRPGLTRLMLDVRMRRVQAVIVLDLSRLSRLTRQTLELVEEMGRAGVQLISCKESFDTATPAGQFFLTLLAAMAQYERDLIAQRTRAALGELSRRTGDAGGRLPYGYTRDTVTPAKIRIDRAAAARVRLIFTWRAQGATLRAIAALLNQCATSPRGARWHASSVAAVLNNAPAYRGGLRGASRNAWPAILRGEQEGAMRA